MRMAQEASAAIPRGKGTVSCRDCRVCIWLQDSALTITAWRQTVIIELASLKRKRSEKVPRLSDPSCRSRHVTAVWRAPELRSMAAQRRHSSGISVWDDLFGSSLRSMNPGSQKDPISSKPQGAPCQFAGRGARRSRRTCMASALTWFYLENTDVGTLSRKRR